MFYVLMLAHHALIGINISLVYPALALKSRYMRSSLLFVKYLFTSVLNRQSYEYNQLMALQYIRRSSKLQIACIKDVFVLVYQLNIFFMSYKIFMLYAFYYFCCKRNVAIMYCCVFVALIINERNFEPIKFSI